MGVKQITWAFPSGLAWAIAIVVLILLLPGNVLPEHTYGNTLTSWRFGVDGANFAAADWIAELNDTTSGVNLLTWETIEPTPPINGRHKYNFELADRLVRRFQDVGRRLQVNIRCISGWATVCPSSPTGELAGPPKPEYWDDYAQFVYELVERYDGDGYKDMPGLELPILYYQIESEPHNLFKGTPEEYVRLLETAYKAAKEANPDVVIMASVWNPGDLFVDYPPPETVEERVHSDPIIESKFNFILYVLKNGEDYFDVLTIHPSAYYTGIPGMVDYFKKEMQQFGYQKPIWADDMASAFLETNLFLLTPIPLNAKEIHDILKNPSDPRYYSTLKGYQAEQSKLLIKRIVVGFGAGLEKIFISTDIDWITYHMDDWKHQGLIYVHPTKPTIHYRKPAFYTYKLAIEKLTDFVSVQRISLEKKVYCYKFDFEQRPPVYVLWSDSGETITDLSPYISTPTVKITHIVTELDKNNDPIYHGDDIVPVDSIEVSDTPVFIKPGK